MLHAQHFLPFYQNTHKVELSPTHSNKGLAHAPWLSLQFRKFSDHFFQNISPPHSFPLPLILFLRSILKTTYFSKNIKRCIKILKKIIQLKYNYDIKTLKQGHPIFNLLSFTLKFCERDHISRKREPILCVT